MLAIAKMAKNTKREVEMENNNFSQSECHSAILLKKYKAPILTHYGDASKLTQATDPATDLILQPIKQDCSDGGRKPKPPHH
jgi:hypothetical protein